MYREIISALKPSHGQVFFDMTFGDGGHTRQLLDSNKDITAITLDRDPASYALACELRKEYGEKRVIPLLGKFSDAPKLLNKIGVHEASLDGIIIETGHSRLQSEDKTRGFNLNFDSPIDLRMDGDRFPSAPTGADVLNSLGSYELSQIFKIYGREKLALKLARTVIDARFMLHSINTTKELYQVIASVSNDVAGLDIDAIKAGASATRVLKSLRAFVNNEYNELQYALVKMRDFLKLDPQVRKIESIATVQDSGQLDELKGGKMIVISHGLIEDSIAKNIFTLSTYDSSVNLYTQLPYSELHEPTEKELEAVKEKSWLSLQKYVRFASEEEVVSNPGAGDARLRQAMRRL